MRHLCIICIWCVAICLHATEVPTFSVEHGYKSEPFTVEIMSATEGAAIYYTTDCTTPSATNGTLYTQPLTINHNTTLRAVAIDANGEASATTAATYLFVDDVLRQDNAPEGYPEQWGPYASIQGTAIGDYEMDPEMTGDPKLRDNIKRGLLGLPVMSIITDPGNLFSDERDDERGGIYIYTGGDASSTGNGYGDGWLRAASVEFWEDGGDGFQVNCAIKIHGNASRMAEKTPKHSFRMKMKSDYGPKKLHYKMFGKGGGKKFNQLVIRAGFGNTWLHWLTSQQKQAMYTRDAWAKRMTAAMGNLSAGTRYAHLFLNGMYWGVYNPTERIDGDFCELHLGGDADDYDVVRFDDGRLNTVDGELDAYQRMYDAAGKCSDYATYQAMQGLTAEGDSLDDGEVLLNINNFIDFMLVNYYGGNGDWDHHNWVAVRSRVANEGFRWLPWDSELVLQGVNDNVNTVRNSKCPTAIFDKLMKGSQAFRIAFADRVYRHMREPFGMLTPDSAQAVWQRLTDEIDEAMYAEAARWGDYRRDVHPYTSRGDLYTKSSHFDKQCNTMRTKYFPQRTDIVLKQFQQRGWLLDISDAPTVRIGRDDIDVENIIIEPTQWVSLRSDATNIFYTTDGTDPVEFVPTTGKPKRHAAAQRYTNSFQITDDCTLKVRAYSTAQGWSPLRTRHFTVNRTEGIVPVPATIADDRYYDLQGRPVAHPTRGIYIHKGKKVCF